MPKNDFLTAPIPGMSLTVEPGNRPWEQPPKMNKVSEVVDYYTERLTEPELIDALLDGFSKDLPIYETAKGLMAHSVMKGLHSIDTGMIVLPVVVEMMKTLADLNDVGYIIQQSDKDKMYSIDKRIAEAAIKEVKEAEMQRQKEPMEEETPKKGLMARGAAK